MGNVLSLVLVADHRRDQGHQAAVAGLVELLEIADVPGHVLNTPQLAPMTRST